MPPGRHGLDRDFVVKNQQDRLTAGIIAVVAEKGYHPASVTEICAAAGVSRRTFYSYFTSKEECYLEAFDRIADHLDAALEDAGAGSEDWPESVKAMLATLLQIFAANPNLVRFTLIAPLRAGDQIAGRRHSVALERILERLTAGKPRSEPPRPSAAVEQAIVGGMMALIAHAVESEEGSRLPELLPELVELFLTPYLGRAEAVRAAGGAR